MLYQISCRGLSVGARNAYKFQAFGGIFVPVAGKAGQGLPGIGYQNERRAPGQIFFALFPAYDRRRAPFQSLKSIVPAVAAVSGDRHKNTVLFRLPGITENPCNFKAFRHILPDDLHSVQQLPQAHSALSFHRKPQDLSGSKHL